MNTIPEFTKDAPSQNTAPKINPNVLSKEAVARIRSTFKNVPSSYARSRVSTVLCDAYYLVNIQTGEFFFENFDNVDYSISAFKGLCKKLLADGKLKELEARVRVGYGADVDIDVALDKIFEVEQIDIFEFAGTGHFLPVMKEENVHDLYDAIRALDSELPGIMCRNVPRFQLSWVLELSTFLRSTAAMPAQALHSVV